MTPVHGASWRTAGLWLKAYRLPSFAALSAALAAALALAGITRLPVLSLTSPVTRHVTVAALLPLASAIALGGRADPGLGEIERSWPAAATGRRLVFLAATEALACAVPLVLLAGPGAGLVGEVVRNVVGLSGLGLISCVIGGAAWAWSAPTLYCIAALTLGEQPNGHPARWAWILRQHPSTLGWLAGLSLLALGATGFIARGPRLHPEEEPA